MARTSRCAPWVGCGLVSCTTVPHPTQDGVFLASVLVLPRLGEKGRGIIQAHGEGETMQLATGAAERAAWREWTRRVKAEDGEAQQLPRDRRRETKQQRLPLGDEGGERA
jgi:hypothetical protein